MFAVELENSLEGNSRDLKYLNLNVAANYEKTLNIYVHNVHNSHNMLQFCPCSSTLGKGIVDVTEKLMGTLAVGINVWQWILHDWNDERCIQILRNCLKALPEHGKVLLAEEVVREDKNSSLEEVTATSDLNMLAYCDGGKERTRAQWNQLLGDAGFARIQFVQHSSNVEFQLWIIECYKN